MDLQIVQEGGKVKVESLKRILSNNFHTYTDSEGRQVGIFNYGTAEYQIREAIKEILQGQAGTRKEEKGGEYLTRIVESLIEWTYQ